MIINDLGNKNSILIDESNNFNDSVRVNINGNNNTVIIKNNCILRRFTIFVFGDNNYLEIGNKNNHRGNLHIRQGSKIIIGSNCTSVDMNLFSLEGKEILIKDNCMFSSRVFIRNSDEHPIIDINSKERINPAKDVIIGKDVWLGESVSINKGTIVADGVIVGSNSVVTKSLLRERSIYAGNPARLIREGVFWKRRL